MSSHPPYRVFPPFRFDAENQQLWRGKKELSLRRKTFEVLRYLVDHPGQLVTKAMLLEAVWPGVVVSDSMPATCVTELRRALGDDAKTPQFIETVHRRGYRFIAQVKASTTAGEEIRKPSQSLKTPKPKMVGREDELARLQRWYSQVREGQRLILFVSGEAGIGKTTFVRAFLDLIAEEGGARLARGQCVEQYGSGEPYMPVLEALSRLGREPGGEQVVELLNKFAPTWLTQMPELLTHEERARIQSEMQGVTQQRMLREMTQALDALAAETPIVLLLEDLHWSDFSTLELISAIARRTESARMLIVGTYRPVEILARDHALRTMKQELELHHYCEEIRLKPLSEENVVDYLAMRLAGDGSRQFGTLAPVIHARTDGNPLFMVNMVDYLLVDTGLLIRSREVSEAEWAETLRVHRLDALRSIRQMIERNLERLQPEEQAVLECASVAGTEFSAAAVAAALERPQSEVEAYCARLSRREQFVREQGPVTWPDGTVAAGFRFHHALYQEVLYARLPVGNQVQLHRRIALREEAGYGARAGEVATELAHHYSRANDKSKAVQYSRLAGERAVARGAVVEAEAHYCQALKMLAELPAAIERDRQELTLQMALGGVLWSSRSWGHPEADRAFTRAQELGEKLGETTQLAAVLLGLVGSALGRGQFKLGHKLAEQMLVAAQLNGNRPALSASHTRLGQALIWRGQYIDAQKHLRLGTDYYDDEHGDYDLMSLMGLDAPALAAIVTLLLGFPDRARLLMNEALCRLKRRSDPLATGFLHMWGGMFSGLLDDVPAVLEHAQALQRLAINQPVWTGLGDLFAGRALMAQGDWEEGVARLRKAVAFHSAVGLDAFRTHLKIGQIEFLASRGQIADALALVDDAVADTEELVFLRPPLLWQRANLLAQSNADPATIDTAYRAAIECARSQTARYYELLATTPFARWLRSQGRTVEAQTVLAEIYDWFTEGFDTPALKEAKALLDELSDELGATRPSEKSPNSP